MPSGGISYDRIDFENEFQFQFQFQMGLAKTRGAGT
jgi:hypothetical protein